jgi:hypothetical protein
MKDKLKALVPMALGVVFMVLEIAGISIDTEFQTSIITFVLALIVYLVPNVSK